MSDEPLAAASNLPGVRWAAIARHGDVRIDQEVREDASFALRVAGGLRGRFTRATGGSCAAP